MEYRIETKPAFKVMGISENFSYETANAEIPEFWNKAYINREPKPFAGKYGVCFDEEMAGNEFRYMIADDYNEQIADAHALDVHEIPAHTWAVFPCRGPMPLPLQEVNRKIFSEWLPASGYSIAEGYNVEYYSDPADYPCGMQDQDYYTEVWIPVKEK